MDDPLGAFPDDFLTGCCCQMPFGLATTIMPLPRGWDDWIEIVWPRVSTRELFLMMMLCTCRMSLSGSSLKDVITEEPSSSAHSSWPEYLLCTVASLFSFSLGWKAARTLAPNAPSQYPTKTVEGQNNPADYRSQGEPSANVAVGSTAAKSPPSPPEKPDSSKRRKEWWKRWKIWKRFFEIAALIAVVAYTTLAYFQWGELHDATVITTRAWVGVSRPIQIKSLTSQGPFAVASPHVNYSVTSKNYGQSTALGLYLAAKPVARLVDVPTAIKETCKQSEMMTRGIYTDVTERPKIIEPMPLSVIFPSDEQGWHFDDKLIAVSSQWSLEELYIVGCITYWDQFREKIRRTRFCYQTHGEWARAEFPALIYQCDWGFNDAN